MAYVIAAPEMMTAAATDLGTIGSDLTVAHKMAAAPTAAVTPAAADEVSAGIAQLFSRYAQGFQSLAGQAAAFHEHFVHNLTPSAGSYAATEAANAASLQHLHAASGAWVPGAGLVANILDFLTNSPFSPFLNNLLNNAISLLGVIGANPLGAILIDASIAALIILTAPVSIPLILYFFIGLSLL